MIRKLEHVVQDSINIARVLRVETKRLYNRRTMMYLGRYSQEQFEQDVTNYCQDFNISKSQAEEYMDLIREEYKRK